MGAGKGTCEFLGFYDFDWELEVELSRDGKESVADFTRIKPWLGKSVMTDLSHLQSVSVWVLLGFHKRVHI